MLSQYLAPIESALVFFPLIAALFTLPYMLYEYRKYGALLFLRTVVVYSFILYMMCAYFLTVLPLPSQEKVAGMTTPYYQLVPFNDVLDIFRNPKIVWNQPRTYIYLIKSSAFIQVVFNVLLTVPFGVYLRYFFKKNLRQTVILSLGLSLFFELTQLSGLYFIYPRPYRLADVCDLTTNTLGGFLGYCLAPWLTRFLPSADRMSEVAYQRSEHVSILRRLFAAGLDCLILLVLFFTVMLRFPPPFSSIMGEHSVLLSLLTLFGYYTLFVLLYFGVLEWALGGRTPGKLFFHLRLIDVRTSGRPRLWQCVVRYGFFYLLVLPMPILALLLVAIRQKSRLFLFGGLAAGALFCVFCVAALIQSGLKGNQLPHGYFSKTKDISTLQAKRKKRLARGQNKAPQA